MKNERTRATATKRRRLLWFAALYVVSLCAFYAVIRLLRWAIVG